MKIFSSLYPEIAFLENYELPKLPLFAFLPEADSVTCFFAAHQYREWLHPWRDQNNLHGD